MQHVRQGRTLVAMVLGVGLTLGNLAAAQGNSGRNAGQQPWMAPVVFAKGELVEAMASKSGLSKADAKKALDGFINATSSALAREDGGTLYCWGSNTTSRASDPPPYLDPDDDGDGLGDLVDFGVFSTTSGGVDAAGCPTPREVVFEAGPNFWPLEDTFAKAIPPSIAGVEVTAPTDRGADNAPRCEKPVRGLDDAFLIESIAREAGLPVRHAALALDACFAVIAQVVNGGGSIDLDGFGRFEAVTEISAKITETRRPPLLVIDVWEHSMSLSGASDQEIYQAAQLLASISKRSARTGRNPQTGKEIKIAAKRTVKFKAGAELSKAVN